jgi:hypothetical protein
MTTGFPPCGLCYASKPLLASCVREEHRPQPARRDAGGSRASWPAGSPPRTGQGLTVAGRVFRGLRHGDGGLMVVSGAIIGSSATRRSRPRIQATAARDTHPDTGTGHADRTA